MAGFAINPDFNWARFGGDALQDLGYGLSNASTVGNAFGTAARYGAQQQPYRDAQAQAEQERRDAALEKNQTSEWIKANFPQYSNLPAAQGWQAAMADLAAQRNAASGDGDPASIREWNTFNAMTPDQQNQYLLMKRSVPYLDLGTGYQQPNPAQPGTAAGPMIPKDNFTPSYDAASGAATGKLDVENQSAVDSLASKMPGLQQVVSELGDLADKATYTQTGQLWDTIVRETGNMPGEGALARTKYMSMVDNQVLPLLKDVFGAAFTVQEGESLRATLGAPDKSPAEKKAVLEAFIEQKVRDLQALNSRLPGTSGGSQQAPTDYKTKYGLE